MISNWDFILRSCLSGLLASIIGFERELRLIKINKDTNVLRKR
ncbi:Uncharacterised protein [Legionella maceachernii]|nr:hypothetical protein SAMN02745128_02310 [Legionella maceachernii]SUP01531.1 Uncharacterised protein [Legionella maceachernii]